MATKEFKVKVIYGSEEGLNAYNEDGTIIPFAMVGEFTFANENIREAFLDGTKEKGGYDKYIVLKRTNDGFMFRLQILFGKEAVENFKECGEIKGGKILNFSFHSNSEIYVFFQALDIAVKYSYNQIISKKMTRAEVIEKLAENESMSLQSAIDKQFLYDLAVKGWKGYDDYTNKELEADYCDAFNEDIEIVG